MVLLRAAKGKEIKGNQSISLCYDAAGENRNGYYAAVDIGTTTLSVEVYNESGVFLGGHAEDNAQGRLGSDVMMRLMHVTQGRGETLTRLIRDQIHQNLQNILCQAAEDETVDLAGMGMLQKITVVGNTVMCHLFLGKDVSGLCGAPFHASYQGCCRIGGRDLGWDDCPGAEILVLPGIAAHVGADAAAVLAAEQLDRPDCIQLAIDLGTNAEILLNHYGEVYVCSAAAGPAFEGRGISCGCRGGSGAVGGVRLLRANGNILLDVTPEQATDRLVPRGLCGSGLIDGIVGLLELGLLQEDGRLSAAGEPGLGKVGVCFAERIRNNALGERCFVLFDPKYDKLPSSTAEASREIYITQADIRNFQLAKAAIQTGISLLCRCAGVVPEEIGQCLVAGVFGAFLHPENAVACGLLPAFSQEKIRFVGNAAGRGAAQALFDADMILRLEERLSRVHHVELAEQEDFQAEFMKNMELRPWGS